eukprot:scaffold64_cov338-Pavlova_lutheri.AAC.91
MGCTVPSHPGRRWGQAPNRSPRRIRYLPWRSRSAFPVDSSAGSALVCGCVKTDRNLEVGVDGQVLGPANPHSACLDVQATFRRGLWERVCTGSIAWWGQLHVKEVPGWKWKHRGRPAQCPSHGVCGMVLSDCRDTTAPHCTTRAPT